MAKAKTEILILDAGSPSMRRLSARLRRQGYELLPSKTPDHAERMLRARGGSVPAALIPVDLPTFDLRAALRFMRRLAPTIELTFVATGRRPADEERRLLAEAGVELALWEPLSEHVLRFQVNRALAGSEIVLGSRSSLRAPADWPVAVWTGSRRKPARVYTISANGAFLATWRPSIPGARLRLDLPLRSGTVPVSARVMMTNVPGDFLRGNLPVGMGVRFEELPEKIASALTRYADRRLHRLGF